MTSPEPATRERKTRRRHRSPHGPGLFVTDLELAEIMGIPEHETRKILLSLDQNPGSRFPQKDPFWGGRRYLPAVEKWLKEADELKMRSIPQRRRA